MVTQKLLDSLEWGDCWRNKRSGYIYKHFVPHEGQQAILDNTKAIYLLALGGVGSGKTACGCLWLMGEVEKHEGKGEYLIVAPTQCTANSATLKVWEKTVRGTPLDGRFIYDKSNPRYILPQGGIIYFRSGEGSLSGIHPHAVLCDELGDCSEDVWITVKERIVDSPTSRILISTTPYPNKYSWIRSEVIAQADKNNEDYFYRCFPTSMNPRHDPRKVKNAQLTLPDYRFKMDYLGLYEAPPSLVYTFIDKDGNDCFLDRLPLNEMGEPSLPQAKGYFGSLDFGGTAATCAIVGMLDVNDCLWVLWEYYNMQKHQDIEKVLFDLREWNASFEERTGRKISIWWCDHRPEIIVALRRGGINARPANKKGLGRQSGKELGISMVQSRIRTGRIKVLKANCPNLKIEAADYRYPMVDGEVVSTTPIDNNRDHALDALRYLVSGIDRKAFGRMARSYVLQGGNLDE